jgi:hypothetical protein
MRSLLALVLFAASVRAAEPANVWKRTDAVIESRRWDVPLGYDPVSKRFLVLGGRTDWANYKKPRPYDVLAFDPSGKWLNEMPAGKDWGPVAGSVTAPPWKSEYWTLTDAAGNTRPNWTVYGTFSLGQKYAYDSDTKAFYFYAGGSTFKYDPAAKQWTDMNPATHPEKELGGILLWSSMCYDTDAKKIVLFGGGNIQTERGDPGTWTYSPSENKWEQLKLMAQPTARANSRLVYDPVHKKVVLFGGDGLNELDSQSWTFDTARQKWEGRILHRPSARAGHALLWLPKSKRVLILGGYTYTSTTEYVASLYKPLPTEAWIFDTEKYTWTCLGHWDKDSPVGPSNFFLSAAANENDEVLVLDSQNRAWTIAIDPEHPLPSGKNGLAARPGDHSSVMRTGSHDPAWYRDVPKPDEDKVASELKDLPANKWMIRPTPKRPLMNMDWGSAVFNPAHDQIIRFSGGHSAYSGTAPFIYDIKTDRYSLPFEPEYPIEYVYSNDQVHGEWSFGRNPWMTGHTYKSTGYDPNLKSLVFAPHDYTYFFNGIQWWRLEAKNPYRPSFYTATVCSTPSGAIVWGDDRNTGKQGVWKLDAKSRSWKPLPLKGELPSKSTDQHGLAHDTKRERLLFFSDNGPKAGNVVSYDMKSGEAKWLDPPLLAKVHCRETAYIPDADLVLIGGRVKDGDGWRWLAFDCAANAWCSLALAGDDPVGKAGAFNNSMGLMYDPARKLVWAVGQHSHVHVLRLDASGKQPLK